MPTKGCKAYIRKKKKKLINYSGGHPDPEIIGGGGGGWGTADARGRDHPLSPTHVPYILSIIFGIPIRRSMED